ncbi:aminoglycoside adenylyltransferase domain-containing protein [Streptomyces hygroscopicus]|uniref:aminoglycoside adenylyltransferase domain-containing protein n=1 Tax=Streptomyces hygroscopicus TaxID=1912 RepID=UPI0037B2D784
MDNSQEQLSGLPESVRRVLSNLLREVRLPLGDRLVGVYLYGCAVTGDFDEGVSDIDLVVAVTDELDHDTLGGLDIAHRRVWAAHPDFLDRIDIVYAPVESLAGQLGASDRSPRLATVSPGSPLHATPATGEWVLNWQLVRDTGITLDGLPVGSVVAPVPADKVRAAVVGMMLSLRERAPQVAHRGGHAYVVLTTCRALLTLTTGRQSSKAQAARWARVRWPHLSPVLDAALEWRQAQAIRDETPLPMELTAQIAQLIGIACTQAEKAR